MGGVLFRLCHNDQRVAEDFLSHHPRGVSGIVLDPKWAREQTGAVEAAQATGVPVYFEPGTERLTHPGFTIPGAGYGQAPWDVEQLARDPAHRTRLVHEVLAAHPEATSALTPAHFLVHDERSANLNLVLADETRASTDTPLRAVLVINRQYAVKAAADLASQYLQAGVRQLELRLTPVGGEEEGLTKVRSVFAVARAFTAAGVEVTLGLSGNIGHTAVVLGHAQHYSVGIEMLEQVNHATTVNRQATPARPVPAGTQDGPRGAVAGVYLPNLAATVSRATGAALLAHSDTKLKVGCRITECANQVAGLMRDVRGHYLHARAHEITQVLTQPPSWRATGEVQRLQRAVQLREFINEHYLPHGSSPLKTRTLRSLIDEMHGEQHEQAARSA